LLLRAKASDVSSEVCSSWSIGMSADPSTAFPVGSQSGHSGVMKKGSIHRDLANFADGFLVVVDVPKPFPVAARDSWHDVSTFAF
jgi:hypothetical protein